ncbi:uncharacterized protein STEHIDRAFT_145665 [Stereum hirsutum FP-91666 SS1]|uniref:uncharacterized protein n=1 Tax=Stereum hirsutum (strain FP-91666) TaxID=721885 RepID=UPI000440A8CD|nr:uncharacterized protein STEHIDRAFT_145665 [Stereum hirsutum FP-91666 SS1]EIM88811.1 hypothetical protein STEHIDRAFT_145665 [Stereum hirsutum FP-91666 SS1]
MPRTSWSIHYDRGLRDDCGEVEMPSMAERRRGYLAPMICVCPIKSVELCSAWQLQCADTSSLISATNRRKSTDC